MANLAEGLQGKAWFIVFHGSFKGLFNAFKISCTGLERASRMPVKCNSSVLQIPPSLLPPKPMRTFPKTLLKILRPRKFPDVPLLEIEHMRHCLVM